MASNDPHDDNRGHRGNRRHVIPAERISQILVAAKDFVSFLEDKDKEGGQRHDAVLANEMDAAFEAFTTAVERIRRTFPPKEEEGGAERSEAITTPNVRNLLSIYEGQQSYSVRIQEVLEGKAGPHPNGSGGQKLRTSKESWLLHCVVRSPRVR